MAVYVPLEDPKATATAGAAISEGLFVKYNAAGTKVEVGDGNAIHCAGVAAEAATADGEGIRLYALDQYARVIATHLRGTAASGKAKLVNKLIANRKSSNGLVEALKLIGLHWRFIFVQVCKRIFSAVMMSIIVGILSFYLVTQVVAARRAGGATILAMSSENFEHMLHDLITLPANSFFCQGSSF